MSGIVLHRVKSYLRDRRQVVRLGDCSLFFLMLGHCKKLQNKPKFMLFGNCNRSTRPLIQVDGVDMMRVHENKFLSVIVDKNIWKSHIKHAK